MERFIYIDTVILGMFLFIVLVCLFGFILMGSAYLKEARKNRQLKKTNKELRYQLSDAQDKLYKKEFKVPEVDEDYECILLKEELGVKQNG